jgi:carbon-monoxide dehydrogenase medium subunit
MIPFELLEPKDLSEACSLLAEYKGKAMIIAGGHGLLPLVKNRLLTPSHLINIKGLSDLDYIKDSGDGLRIGALTTNRALEVSALVKETHPMLAELEAVLGDIQTRNWGTIVGNLCMSSPTSDLAPPLIAIGTIVKVMSIRGEREITLEEFFVDYKKTALEPDEIVMEVLIPKPLPHTGGAYHKERVRATDLPIAAVAVVVTLDEELDTITAARIILQAVCPTPLRAREAEEKIIGKKIQDNIVNEAAIAAAQAARPISDVYGSAEYKREMVKVVTKQVVTQSIERAHRA